jgi:uncharacterized protein
VRYYLHTSAAAKLLIEEPESDALAAFLEGAVEGGDVVGSSRLLETELRRMAIRLEIPQEHVTLLLERLDLLVPDDDVFRTAGLLPGASLRSLDALHVSAARRGATDEVRARREGYAHPMDARCTAVGEDDAIC